MEVGWVGYLLLGVTKIAFLEECHWLYMPCFNHIYICTYSISIAILKFQGEM